MTQIENIRKIVKQKLNALKVLNVEQTDSHVLVTLSNTGTGTLFSVYELTTIWEELKGLHIPVRAIDSTPDILINTTAESVSLIFTTKVGR